MSIRLAGTVLLAGAILCASCASQVAGSAPPGSSAPLIVATPATASSSTTAGAWVAGSDPATGIGFLLPGTASAQTGPGSDGTPGAKRTYSYQVDTDFGVSVTVADGAVDPADLDGLPDRLAGQFTASGAPDAKVTERQRSTVASRPALDFRFSFTAQTGKRVFFLVRYVAGERALVVLQTTGFSASPDAAFENRLRDYHGKLLAGLKLA